MIIWLDGTHGSGKTTTGHFLQPLIPYSRIFDAEKVGETLMDITPSLPETDNVQHWPPWRSLVTETASQILAYVGGTLIIPMTVLTEQYWRDIRDDFHRRNIPVHHFVPHTNEATLRQRIDNDTEMGPSTFRHRYVATYITAASTWLHEQATVIDTTNAPAQDIAQEIAERLRK